MPAASNPLPLPWAPITACLHRLLHSMPPLPITAACLQSSPAASDHCLMPPLITIHCHGFQSQPPASNCCLLRTTPPPSITACCLRLLYAATAYHSLPPQPPPNTAATFAHCLLALLLFCCLLVPLTTTPAAVTWQLSRITHNDAIRKHAEFLCGRELES